MITRLRAALPYLVLAAILASSAFVLLRDPHELLLAHAFSLLGPIVIFAGWFRYRSKVSIVRVLPAFLIILFIYFRAQAFHQLSLSGSTFDEYLLFADRGFGFHPSLAAYSFVDHFGLFTFISIVYESLFFALALCYALQMSPSRKAGRIFAVFFLAAILGALCYKFLPACGPVWLLGSSCYTGEISSSCADISATDLGRVQLDGSWPRNAMPSLHMAWALLIWWALRDRRIVRWIALTFACCTALATLGGGEHYLVDLIAAFPFALAVWSLSMGDPPFSDPRRLLPFAGSCAALLLWIDCIRFDPTLFQISPVLTWAASLAIVAGTLIVLFRYWPVDTEVRNSLKA